MSQTNSSLAQQINGQLGRDMVSIEGRATGTSMLSSKNQQEAFPNQVMEKIDFYTSELHRLLDIVNEGERQN